MQSPSEAPLSYGEGPGVRSKRCPRCGNTKPFYAFSKDKSKKDGLDSDCKACRAAYYAANAEAHREYRRAYHATHIEAFREYSRSHRAARPDIHRAATHRRRARIKGNGGHVTAHELAA